MYTFLSSYYENVLHVNKEARFGLVSYSASRGFGFRDGISAINAFYQHSFSSQPTRHLYHLIR